MRLVLATAALAALLALSPLAASYHDCEPDPFIVYAGAGAGGPNAAYVVVDCFMCGEFGYSVWVYLESNGVTGVQRGGANLFGDYDFCQTYPVGHDEAVF